jgi:DNA polymerase-3 subunit epsilon
MNTWHQGRLLAFDLETTAPDPDVARIVTATLIELDGRATPVTHEWLADPGVPIPAGASAIHGITTQRAQADGADPDVVVFELLSILAPDMGHGVPVVAFNAAYDLTVLDRECRRHGIDTLTTRLGDVAPVVDPHVIDKQVDKYRKGKRTLGVTCAHYGIDLRNAHDATADALGAARLAWKLAHQYPVLQVPLDELHAQQVGWRAEQAAGLQKHFRKKDPAAVVCGDWPVQQLPDGWDPAAHPVDEPATVGAS